VSKTNYCDGFTETIYRRPNPPPQTSHITSPGTSSATPRAVLINPDTAALKVVLERSIDTAALKVVLERSMDIYGAHLGHEQLTAVADTLRGNKIQGHINGLSRVDIPTDCVDRTCRPVEVSIY
jgi:hypothetical protein